MSTMVTMTVRGRNFLMLKNMRYLCLNLGDSLELMNWFLAQMRADLANPREEEVADPSEFEDLAKVGAPFKKRKKTQELTTQDTPVQNLVKKALEDLKKDTSVKRASFDMVLGKFRVVLTTDKIMYKTIRNWKLLCQQDDLFRLQAALDTIAGRFSFLQSYEAGLEAPPLEVPGLESPPHEPDAEFVALGPLAECVCDGDATGEAHGVSLGGG